MTDFELKTSRQQDTQDFATEQTPPEPPKASTMSTPPDKNMELCLELMKAESEDAVQKIIDKNPEMSDSDNWYPLDGRSTNFNVVTNQASTGGKAATELMTNMVDAILTKQAYLKGIDPKGKTDDVPKTMYDAVDQLVRNLHGGHLVNSDRQWLQNYSTKNLIIGINASEDEGASWDKPCLTFADNGEGQNSDSFEKTFLSLSEGNKKDIPFVQGKFNMGSSGVLGFCGKKWFKLIISRRYDLNEEWGWTLMRRRPSDGESVPVADYFKINKKIPTFNADSLYPLNKKDGNIFSGFSLSSGTIIKLYDFELGSKGIRSVRNAFSENLVETILPFKIYDLRYQPSPKRKEGIDVQYFYGMEYSLRRSEENTEDNEYTHLPSEEKAKLTVAIINDPEIGTIRITAIPLGEKMPIWLKQSGSRVFHSVNGQVQFKETRGVLTKCGYPALKDRVVIIVDASQLSFEAHNDIWKGDREHLRLTPAGNNYKLIVEEAIKKSDVLKELHNKIAEEELKKTTQKGSADLFQKLVDTDPTLANLLNNRDPSITLLNTTKADENEYKYEGKFSPTFLELEGKFRDKSIKIPVNKSRPISAKTDVVNDYFHRADSTGKIHFSGDPIEKYFLTRGNLKDGRLTVYFSPNSNSGLTPGMKFNFMLGLNDPTMPTPKQQPITIIITERNDEPKKPRKEKNDDPKKETKPPSKDLPKHKLLTKDGRQIFGTETEKWPDGFNELDGGTVSDFGDQGSIYEINYDNAYHLKYRMAKHSEVEKDTLSQKYILGMRLLMFGFERALQDKKDTEDSSSVADFEDNFRTMAAKGAATTILSLIEGLAKVTTAPDDE